MLVATDVVTGPVGVNPYGFYTSQFSTEAVAGDLASPGSDVIDYSSANPTASIKSYVNLYQPFEFDPFPAVADADEALATAAEEASHPAAADSAANSAAAAAGAGCCEVTSFRRAPASRTVSKSSDEGVCLSISEGKSRMKNPNDRQS